MKEEILDTSPCDGVSVKAPNQPQNTASNEQMAEALKAAKAAKGRRFPKVTGPRDHLILLLLASTGARRSEIGLATFADARDYIKQGMFYISHSKSQPRLVPLTAETEKALWKWLRLNRSAGDTDCLWLVKDGPQLHQPRRREALG